jgi:anti-anti-sigma factor
MLAKGLDGYTSRVPHELEIDDHDELATHTLALTGELDVASATKLEQTVTRLCQRGAREIVLDLHELAFIDSTGFRAILSCRRTCEEFCVAFAMTRARAPVQHLFDMTGMLRRLPFR